jgi:hypothetical protein
MLKTSVGRYGNFAAINFFDEFFSSVVGSADY